AHARLRRSCGGYDAVVWRSDRTLARSPTTEDARWLLRHVGTGLGDLAILNRGCAGGTNGPDNLAIRDERNAALQRRGSASRERTHTQAALRHQVLDHLARTPVVKRAARLVLGDRDRAVLGVVELVEHHDMAGAVENGDGHAPVVLHRLRLRGRHHFFG